MSISTQTVASMTPPMTCDLSTVSDADLIAMQQAGNEVLTCLAALGRGASNPVAKMLRDAGQFYEDNHYPDGDVYDAATASQYYYHAHRAETGEHGHFHTFIRAAGIPADILPAPYSGSHPPPVGQDAICHLVAVSMNAAGLPVGLFTTNRWVTAETFYTAPNVITMLPTFKIDHAEPCWATNRWLSAMLHLFRPHIENLLRQRDETIAAWQAAHADSDCFEDRALEVTSECVIDIDAHIAAIDDELAKRPMTA